MQSTSLKRQQGASIIIIMVFILMAVALSLFGIKVGPTYLENWTLKEMMERLETDKSLVGTSQSKIRADVMKRIRSNGVYKMKQDNLKLVRKGEYYELSLDYVVQKPLFGNMEILMTFSEQGRIPTSN